MSDVNKKVFEAFQLDFCDYKPLGNGHINGTFLLQQDGVVLQKINTNIFADSEKLMENIVNVTSFLKKKILLRGGNPDRECLTFIPSANGKYYFKDENGSCWRAMKFIDGTFSYEKAEDLYSFEEAGLCFGRFFNDLSDFPVSSLHEVIPGFHDTKLRLEQFNAAVDFDICKRSKNVSEEIAFLRDRAFYADRLPGLNLPLRVTHNDTKLNNVLIDNETGKGICVIDLDTIMPGYSAIDFGDAIRTGASTAEEDERDISKIGLDIEMFRAFQRGFINGAGNTLTGPEVDSFPTGALVITYEQSLRFLTDYLNGDVYYKTAYSDHNLVRARAQIALLKDMEKKLFF